jgi:23S rRNA A1618 N6-methylase RlmF
VTEHNNPFEALAERLVRSNKPRGIATRLAALAVASNGLRSLERLAAELDSQIGGKEKPYTGALCNPPFRKSDDIATYAHTHDRLHAYAVAYIEKRAPYLR